MDTRIEQPFTLVDQHAICLLPFGFDDARQTLQRLNESPRWHPRVFRSDDVQDIERTTYFLPYIRRLLFPKLPRPGQEAAPIESSCRHYVFHMPLVTGDNQSTFIDLELSGEDNQDKQPFQCPLRLERIELLIFPFEVGFLLFDFRCSEPDATFTTQMKALGMLRMLAPLFLDQAMPVLTQNQRRFHMPQLVAYLLGEFETARPPVMPTTPEMSTILPVRLINDERLMVYSFSCLDRHSGPREASDAEGQLRKRSLMSFDEESLLHAKNAKERGLAPWQRVRFQSFNKDGGMLVAFCCESFDEKYLGQYHRTYYFDIFLLSTLQRVALLRLYERLADIPNLTIGGRVSQNVLARLRHDLLLFKTQCCFSQITLRERGLSLWRRWQQTFENETLLKEVNEQSSELEQYLRTQSRERFEWIARLGGFVATVVPAILGLDVVFSGEWVQPVKFWLLAAVFVGTGIAVITILFRRPKF